MRQYPVLICCALAIACSPSQKAEQEATNDAVANGEAQHLPKVPLLIRHGESAPDRRIEVEIALTPEEQEKGLMHRTDLKSGEGMIFPMVPPRLANFWMKNTPVSLDIVFIRTDGSIARIVRGAKPGDRTPLFAEAPVSGVLELPAGDVAALAIDEGDRINWGACVASGKRASVVEADNFCPS